MTLKYQGSFVRAARECSVVDGNMVMKIGVEGRVVVGPAGGPGKVDVPLRFAVVQETPSGIRPIATKFLVIPVVVDATGNTPFVHVEDMMFPIPTPTAQARRICGLCRLRSGFGRSSGQAAEGAAEIKIQTGGRREFDRVSFRARPEAVIGPATLGRPRWAAPQ